MRKAAWMMFPLVVLLVMSCTTTVPSAQERRQDNMSTYDELFEKIESLASVHPFRSEKIANLTKSTLQMVAAESTPYFTVLRSTQVSDPWLTEIEVRIPTAQADAKDGLLLLTLSGKECIGQTETMAKFGKNPELEVPTPRQPPNSPVYLLYRYDWGVLKLGFAQQGSEECLSTVVLDAIGQ
jgi:hypothetical protein